MRGKRKEEEDRRRSESCWMDRLGEVVRVKNEVSPGGRRTVDRRGECLSCD